MYLRLLPATMRPQIYIGGFSALGVLLIIIGGSLLGSGCSPEYPALCTSGALTTQRLVNITTGYVPCTTGSAFECYFATYNFETCTYTTASTQSLTIGDTYSLYMGAPGICTPTMFIRSPYRIASAGISFVVFGVMSLALAIGYALYDCNRKRVVPILVFDPRYHAEIVALDDDDL
jgi:hypothetical protein